jgi:hypothetical protein
MTTDTTVTISAKGSSLETDDLKEEIEIDHDESDSSPCSNSGLTLSLSCSISRSVLMTVVSHAPFSYASSCFLRVVSNA